MVANFQAAAVSALSPFRASAIRLIPGFLASG